MTNIISIVVRKHYKNTNVDIDNTAEQQKTEKMVSQLNENQKQLMTAIFQQ